ncbi:family 20 glycosylhydrolase [Microbulbifer sp. TRSA002]|uniref:family 20 glycosylhydrolase n=1 Tax=Microbulbifer sp. TRSA002 TaxID=3243382 RepID=UPI0040395D07
MLRAIPSLNKTKLKTLLFPLALGATSALTGCGGYDDPERGSARQIAEDFSVQLEVLTNYQAAGDELAQRCKREGGSGAICSTYRISLSNAGKAALAPGASEWNLYFHSVRRTLALINRDDLRLEHVKGDLHRLVPLAHFPGLAQGETLQLDFLAEYWFQFESDFMPRLFTVDAEGQAHVIHSTDSDSIADLVQPIPTNHPDNWKRVSADANVLATATSRFEEFSRRGVQEGDRWKSRIIPKPLQHESRGIAVDVSAGVTVNSGAMPAETVDVIKQRLSAFGLTGEGAGAYPVSVEIDTKQFVNTAESYWLEAGETGALIIAADQAGAFYGLQSLLGLIDVRAATLTTARVVDAPRFPHRGLFLDVGRNFHSKALVLKLLDQMAAYKLNRFHLHLSDDEGWRLEVPGLPELTEIGSRRCFDLEENRCLLPQLGSGPTTENNGSGHFSVEDYIEIVRYAGERHIEVIPEFDMPAHARAAVVSMEARYRRLKESDLQAAARYRLIDAEDSSRFLSVQFYDDSYVNPCIDSTYQFVGKVISEVQAMHQRAGYPLQSWHFGGDEAVNILASNSFEDAPGQDPAKGDVDAGARQQPWSGSPQCQKLVASGAIADISGLGSYYARRVASQVHDAGIPTLGAWNDGVKAVKDAGEELATENNYVNSWAPLVWGGGDESSHFAAAGFGVVQSHSDFLYFDMPYEVDPKEPGYYWASRYTDTRKTFSYAPLITAQLAEVSTDRDGNAWSAKAADASFATSVRGIQGNLWSEVVRTDAQVEYMMFPRLLALAERAWHQASWELDAAPGQEFSAESGLVDVAALDADWGAFAAALGHKELLKLDLTGVGYRIPVPGALNDKGHLKVAQALPGLVTEYHDGESWRPITAETPAEKADTIRTRSADGRRTSRAVSVSVTGGGL